MKHFLSQKHNNTRHIIEELVALLNRKVYWYDSVPYGFIGIEEYNPDKDIVRYGELKEIKETLKLLLDYLDLEIFDGKEIRKRNKEKARRNKK